MPPLPMSMKLGSMKPNNKWIFLIITSLIASLANAIDDSAIIGRWNLVALKPAPTSGTPAAIYSFSPEGVLTIQYESTELGTKTYGYSLKEDTLSITTGSEEPSIHPVHVNGNQLIIKVPFGQVVLSRHL